MRTPTPARRFADLLEGLGTSFVKLGQHLSLRSDLFPADYPGFSLLDSLCERSREVLQTAIGNRQQETRRLQFETAIASTEWQRLLAASLRRLREDGLHFKVDHEGLPELAERIVTGSSRVALALVTLGLYLAASLLMQFKSGPQIFDFPALPALFLCGGGLVHGETGARHRAQALRVSAPPAPAPESPPSAWWRPTPSRTRRDCHAHAIP